jgi:hypothetical protein
MRTPAPAPLPAAAARERRALFHERQELALQRRQQALERAAAARAAAARKEVEEAEAAVAARRAALARRVRGGGGHEGDGATTYARQVAWAADVAERRQQEAAAAAARELAACSFAPVVSRGRAAAPRPPPAAPSAWPPSGQQQQQQQQAAVDGRLASQRASGSPIRRSYAAPTLSSAAHAPHSGSPVRRAGRRGAEGAPPEPLLDAVAWVEKAARIGQGLDEADALIAAGLVLADALGEELDAALVLSDVAATRQVAQNEEREEGEGELAGPRFGSASGIRDVAGLGARLEAALREGASGLGRGQAGAGGDTPGASAAPLRASALTGLLPAWASASTPAVAAATAAAAAATPPPAAHGIVGGSSASNIAAATASSVRGLAASLSRLHALSVRTERALAGEGGGRREGEGVMRGQPLFT